MRVTALFVVFLLGAGSVARAEKVKTNQATKVYSHEGEQGPIVAKVKAGQNMTVLAKEGRWIKVRVQGRTGYVPRSKVDMADDDELVRNTRRRPFVDGRGVKRGFGGEAGPDDRVGADATGAGDEKKDDDDSDKPKKHAAADDDDSDKPKKHKPAADDDDDNKPKSKKPKAEEPKKHKPAADDDDDDSDKPKPKKHKGDDDDDDTKVSDDDTSSGKGDEEVKEPERPMAHVTEKTKIYDERDKDSGTAFAAKPTDVLYPTDKKGKWTYVENEEGDSGWILSSKLDMEESSEGGPRKRIIDLRARMGFTFITQSMHSTGSTITGTDLVPDNYTIGTSALAIALGGGILVPYKKDYVVGGEATYDYANTVAGGVYYKSVNTGISLHDVNVRAIGGYDLHKKNGMTLLARLGYRYQGYLVANYADPTKNPAKLPSEVFKAPTIGAALAIPRLTEKIGVKVALDAIVAGASITQTTGYEDGSNPSAKALCLGGVFTYRWKKDMDLQGTYDLNYAAIDFGPPLMTSIRGHTGTDTQRTDLFHTLTFGVTRAF